MSEKQFYLDYAIKEIVCACMSIKIPAQDVERIRKMTKQEVSDYIDAELAKPGADEMRGKEYTEASDGYTGTVSLFENEMGRETLFDELEEIYEESKGDADPGEDVSTVDKSRVIDMSADVVVKVKRPQTEEVIIVGNIQVPRLMENADTKQRLYTFVGEEQRPTLAECQLMVDGNIEIVTIKADTLVPVGSQLIVNDEGCMEGRVPLPINPVATQLYHSTCIPGTTAKIHGHAILLAEGAQLD